MLADALSDNPVIDFILKVLTLNNSFHWDAVWTFIFSSFLLQGVVMTIILSVLAQFFGSLMGLALYFARRARNGFVRRLGGVYIWFFRGTPLIVQIYMFYLILPYLKLSRPLRALDVFSTFGFQNIFFDSFIAACIALSLNEGAYMSEIVRAGIDSIDVGQMEAAKSLGMTYWLGMRRIVLPQAMRVIIPPLGNEFNNMLKSSSLASAASLSELYVSAQLIGGPRFLTLELLVTASIWYLAMTTAWGVAQSWIERKFSASTREPTSDGRTFLQRAFGFAPRLSPVTSGIPAENVPALPTDRR